MRKGLLFIVFIVILIVFWPYSSVQHAPAADPTEFVSGAPRLARLLGAADSEGYRQALTARPFRFPEDHGPHPEYRNEWWYVTGNLHGENGQRFGFELTLFRFSVTATSVADDSAWRTKQVYIGHFAITDLRARKFRVATRYSRGGVGLAGAQSNPFRVWLEQWELGELPPDGGVDESAQAWYLRAMDDDIAIDLTLMPRYAPVSNGIDGLSKKSAAPGNASYYYSLPRLRTTGTLRSGEQIFEVSGLSWLDREWGSGGLSLDQQGWDWFALQLSDGSSLMFYDLRKTDGTRDLYSAGTFVAKDGTATPLSRDEVVIDVLEYWDSPAGGRYPMGWRMTIASHELSLRISPILRGQELDTLVRYWEGAVDVAGERRNNAISGRGYVELTGYAADSPAP
ncbi:MAG: carotenoid 1,2-hydratase [Gammaproteobacteria bacterium]|nr:carotenoid 1,2-hydratase [Gammaproteobacteria bacterium]